MKAGDAVRIDWAGRTWDARVCALAANPSYVHVEVVFGGGDDPVPMFVHTGRVT